MSLSGVSLTIEKLAAEKDSYIEAVVDFAEENELDVEEIVSYLHPQIVAKLKLEFIRKNHFADKKAEPSVTDFFGSVEE